MFNHVFNSLGSNYSFWFSMKMLFSFGSADSNSELKNYLEEKYNGKVYLLYKGREALEILFQNGGFQKDDVIVVSGYTCAVVPKAVTHAGAKPLFIDIENGNMNFSINELKLLHEKNPNIKAVVIQNTLGFTVDILPIENFCKEKNIILVEDLAHCVGAHYPDGRETGTVGDYAMLSFSQDKLLDVVSGGALICRNGKDISLPYSLSRVSGKTEIIDRLYPIFTWKIRKLYGVYIGKWLHVFLKRFKLLATPVLDLEKRTLRELPSYLAPLVLYRLKNLNHSLMKRRVCANHYFEHIKREYIPKDVTKDSIKNSACLRFPIIIDDPSGLVDYLKDHNIHVSDIWYDVPIAPKKYWPLFRDDLELPNSTKLSMAMINLPTHKEVTIEHLTTITTCINTWSKLNSKK